jgi:hypothetical protein
MSSRMKARRSEDAAGQSAARERKPAIVFLIVGLFAGGNAICMALIAPVLWAAARDTYQQSRLTYQQCGDVTDDTSRLDCFDRIVRQNSVPQQN